MPKADDGATLIIALIIVTTVALVVAGLLGQSTASVRTTEGLRDQVGSTYAGDGAAQVAINALRNSTFNNATGSHCFGAGDALTLQDFYPKTGGLSNGGGTAASSAAITCTPVAGTGAQGTPVPITSANKPGQAILTLSQSGTETGQVYGQASNTVTIHGAVTSDSTISSPNPTSLIVTGGVPIKAVTGCSGSITPACTIIGAPGVNDPNYAPPATAPAAPSTPVCPTADNGPEVFGPGLYNVVPTDMTPVIKSNGTSAAACDKNIGWYYFKPGTYYFDFTSGSHVWTTSATTVAGTLAVGGTSPGGAQTKPAVPGACINPIESVSAIGVEFVFGGDSQLSLDKNTNSEFCATYSATSIPRVVYGLKSDLGTCPGATCVHAESGCVANIAPAAPRCDVISDPGNGTKPIFFFEGFVYTPKGSINLAVNNTAQPYFNFGIISRTLTLTTTGSACGTCAYISLPDNSPGLGTAATVIDLTVYVCQGVSTNSCDTLSSHKVALTARVKVDDPTGSPVAHQRKITVLSWNEKRCQIAVDC